MSYNNQSFWMHDATGEALLSILSKEIEKKSFSSKKMQTLRKDIEDSLKSSWITGFLSSLGDEYISDKECADFIVDCIEKAIHAASSAGDNLNVNSCCVQKNMFLEEIVALKCLIKKEKEFLAPPKIFSLAKCKWIIA